MNSYWLLAPTVATSLIAVAFALLWHREAREREIEEYQRGVCIMERDEARLALDRCERDNELFGETVVKLNEEKLQLEAHNADLLEALRDAQAENKALHQQTAPIAPVVIAEKAEPAKRSTRAKTKAKVEE